MEECFWPSRLQIRSDGTFITQNHLLNLNTIYSDELLFIYILWWYEDNDVDSLKMGFCTTEFFFKLNECWTPYLLNPSRDFPTRVNPSENVNISLQWALNIRILPIGPDLWTSESIDCQRRRQRVFEPTT